MFKPDAAPKEEDLAEKLGIIGAEDVPGVVAFSDGMPEIDPTAPEEIERMLAAMKEAGA